MAKKGKYAWRRVTPLRVSREHVPVRRRRRKHAPRVETPEALPETAETPVVIDEPEKKIQDPVIIEEIDVRRELEEPVVEVDELPTTEQVEGFPTTEQVDGLPTAEQVEVPPVLSGQQDVPSLGVSPPQIEEKKGRPGARVILTLILISVSLVSGFSIAGLLQSTESVGTSGIVVQPVPPPPPAPPAPPPEPTVEIDVYGDSGCTNVVTEVAWGSIQTGSSASEIVYVKNAGEASVSLSLLTDNWDPVGAAGYMTLSWNYDGNPIEPGAVLEVVLTLSIDSSGTDLAGFTFDIVFVGSAL